MRLTVFTDYGIRILMRLAGEPERLFTIEEMSTDLQVSHNHLTKVIQSLAKAGYIKTFRGKGGGFQLAPDAGKTPIGNIVRWLEPDTAVVECFRADGGNCTLTSACRFKHKILAARKAFLSELDSMTLEECAIPADKI